VAGFVSVVVCVDGGVVVGVVDGAVDGAAASLGLE